MILKVFSPHQELYFCSSIKLMSFFKDKVVVITGGSEGIGKALVEALICAGAKVATCGRNHAKLYDLHVQHPNVLLHTLVCDVSKEPECRRFIESTIKAFGGIDILINNAGVSMRALVEEADVEILRRVMDVNFYGTVYCTRFALPSIIERKGTIVGVSSIAGYRGLPGRSAYSASKFALHGWLESLRTELFDKNVNVMWVCPGFTASNIRFAALTKDGQPHGATMEDEGGMMSAKECAGHILKSIEKRKRTLVLTFTGKRTVFLNRFFPALTDKLIHKYYFREGKLIK